MIFLYQILSIILSPFVDIYLFFRKFKNKEDKSRFNERLGYSQIIRPFGNLIWLHCASIGESKSALTLAQKIIEHNPKTNLLITSGTVTSAKEINKSLPTRTIHQYVPVDKFFAVNRFIKHWQPDLAIFIESELWPNLITIAKKKCQLILVNGRISDNSFKKWQILHKIGFNLLKKFSLCFAQSQYDQQKFIDLGTKNVHFVGNLKYAGEVLNVDKKELQNLRQEIGNRVFWLASSSHKGEEEIIIDIHQKLKCYFPDLLTIITPRHINRIEEIIKLIPKNIKFSIRSKKQKIGNCDIYLTDTMGELGIFYSLSKISLICGSLIDKIGGHNPIEALQLGSIILSGNYIKNNQEIYQDLIKSESCIMVNNQEELLFFLLKLIKDKQFYLKILENTKKMQGKNHNVPLEILAIVKKEIKGIL